MTEREQFANRLLGHHRHNYGFPRFQLPPGYIIDHTLGYQVRTAAGGWMLARDLTEARLMAEAEMRRHAEMRRPWIP